MARWSLPIKLSEYVWFDDFLNSPGCYVIGFLRGGEFNPKYIGHTTNLYRRARQYMNPAVCHNDFIYAKLCTARHNLYMRVIRTRRNQGMEARLQVRHGIGRDGLYAWNKRTEWSYVYA